MKLDDLFDSPLAEDTLDFFDNDIDTLEEVWHHGYATSDDYIVCKYGCGDHDGLCIKEIYGCYFVGCEHAD